MFLPEKEKNSTIVKKTKIEEKDTSWNAQPARTEKAKQQRRSPGWILVHFSIKQKEDTMVFWMTGLEPRTVEWKKMS